jgi:hypothetical protein
MNETTGASPSEPANPLMSVHRQWALYATRQLQLRHPELTLKLYGDGEWTYTLHVMNCSPGAFPALAEYFDHDIRPLTCNIRLSQEIPTEGSRINGVDDYTAELWLRGQPLSAPSLNNLLWLAEPELPDGGINFDNARNAWVFRSFQPLSDDEKIRVQRATDQIGIAGPLDFVEVASPTPPPPAQPPFRLQGDLTLITSRRLKRIGGTRHDLVQQDEDEWRAFLAHRARQEVVSPEVPVTKNFACLYDVEHCGESRLSELLTLYDRVDIALHQGNFDEWSRKHQVPLPDLQELVRLKRIRLILPRSGGDYPAPLIDAVAEVDRSALVLSRSLAAQTIIRGQAKEPLLYAPLTHGQRAGMLTAIAQTVTDDKFRAVLSTYGKLFAGQHDMFMQRGAMASLGFGVGAYLGEVLVKFGKKDARLELMTCGAAIEWALGLDASYIPRDFAGYDETHNSHIIASYLGRTRSLPTDPVANRMHVVTEGLLALSGVPPIEVARSFHGLPASRFRGVARNLMHAASSAADLQEAVEKMNADVKAFERRADRLASWKVGSLLPHIVAGVIDHAAGLFASIGAVWIYEHLEHRVPKALRGELSDAKAMLVGLATGSSMDTVIVSRSRKAIESGR